MDRNPIVWCCALAVASAPAAVADTILVPGDHETIQAAITAASNGDEIVVGPGTYFEKITLEGKVITLRSSGGPAVTTIDGSGQGDHVIRCNSGEGPNTIIDGFTVTGGNNAVGGGIYFILTNPKVMNCIFDNNGAVGGAGLYAGSGASPTIIDCTFSSNTASAEGGGAFCSNSSPEFINCVFHSNFAVRGGGLHNAVGSSPTLTNCTFSANTGSQDGGGVYTQEGAVTTIRNSVLWANTPNAILGTGGETVSFSDIQGGWPGTGNIDADPDFVDAFNDDYRLEAGSPSLDAADNGVIPGSVTTDRDGNPRFVDDAGAADCPQAPGQCGTAPIADMGAYERSGGGGNPCPGDITGPNPGDPPDGVIDVFDLLRLLANFGTPGPDGDITGPSPGDPPDGVVNVFDLLALLAVFGQVCP